MIHKHGIRNALLLLFARSVQLDLPPDLCGKPAPPHHSSWPSIYHPHVYQLPKPVVIHMLHHYVLSCSIVCPPHVYRSDIGCLESASAALESRLSMVVQDAACSVAYTTRCYYMDDVIRQVNTDFVIALSTPACLSVLLHALQPILVVHQLRHYHKPAAIVNKPCCPYYDAFLFHVLSYER